MEDETRLAERSQAGLHLSIVEQVPDISTVSSVLDIGCGTGAWLARVRKLGIVDLHGVDRDIKQFSAPGVKATQHDIDSDGIEFDRQFELITAIELIEHLENPGNLFKMVESNLSANGLFILTTPNVHSVTSRVRFLFTGSLPSFDSKGDPTHLFPVLLTTLERILPRYSMHIESCWGYPPGRSLAFRKVTRLISTGIRPFVNQGIDGDTLCLLIKRNPVSSLPSE